MKSSSFSPYINILALIIISLFLFVNTEDVSRKHNLPQNPNFRFVEEQSQKLFRGLNLSPGRDANIVEDDHLVNASEIVEKRFRFPSLISTATSTGRTNVTDFGHHAGYYKLPNTKAARIFYYFFESRKNDTNAPVVVWLSGGPGCSSSIALFYENGPFYLTDNLSLAWNDYGWDLASNILFIDQPTGTGFSYTTNKDDIRIGSNEAAVDFYNFLQAFYKKHPEYTDNKLYITGESYAGHYIPAFATQIHRENKNKNRKGLYINLKGLAIGNGMTNTPIQYAAYPDYALSTKLINQSLFNELRQSVPKCQREVNKSCVGTTSSSACAQAYNYCYTIILSKIISHIDGLNYYDIRKKCEGDLCYDLSNMERFLNKTSVRNALRVPSNLEFVSCSYTVADAMVGDGMLNFAVDIPELLHDGISLLVYVGEYDLLCNWLGNWRWVADMTWSGQNGFLSAHNVTFNVDGVEAGLLTSHGPLTFLKVHNAGHLVPMDQRKPALEMLIKWMNGSLH